MPFLFPWIVTINKKAINDSMKNWLKTIFHLDHIIVAFLTIIIIELMVAIAINLDFLSPVVRSLKSFSMTDIYYKIQNNGEPTDVCSSITLVDMTELTYRKDIAQVIREINEMKPSVLGIDLIFESEKADPEGDKLLAEACLQGNPSKTVLAYKLINYDEDRHTYQKDLHAYFSAGDGIKEGFVNLVDNPEKCVRRYANVLPYQDTLAYSFPFQISQMVTEKAGSDEAMHTINYKSVVFPVIKYNELQNYREYITDHIVLLGTTEEERDKFYTPIGQKSGMEILAYTILSMTECPPVKHAGLWVIFLWALIAGYLTNLIDYFLTKRVQGHQSTMMVFVTQSELYDKIISFLVMVLITWLSFELYVKYSYFVDTVLPLATIVMIEEGRLLYVGLLSVLKKKKKKFLVRKSIYAKEIE